MRKLAAALRGLGTELLEEGPAAAIQEGVTRKAGREIAARGLRDSTLYVVDLAEVLRLYAAWRRALPRVTPFYAIKCNPDPGVLRVLDALGAGFDCASRGEMERVLGLGVAPSRIILAHPCKRARDLEFASEAGVDLTTFDTLSELHGEPPEARVAILNAFHQYDPYHRPVLATKRIRASDGCLGAGRR